MDVLTIEAFGNCPLASDDFAIATVLINTVRNPRFFDDWTTNFGAGESHRARCNKTMAANRDVQLNGSARGQRLRAQNP